MKNLITVASSIAGIIILAGLYSGKILLIVIGLIFLILIFLLFYLRGRFLASRVNGEIYSEIDDIKKNGELIQVDFDKCEIKERSYSQDIIDERMMRLSQINFNYGKVIGQEHIGQSLLVYNYLGNNGPERFIQAFPFGSESLKFRLIKNLITLYVDKSNRSRYFFDLKPG